MEIDEYPPNLIHGSSSPMFLMDLPSQSQNQYQQQPQHQMGYPQYGVSAGMSNQYISISQAAAMATAAASGQCSPSLPLTLTDII
jgi:hypothetical protein